MKWGGGGGGAHWEDGEVERREECYRRWQLIGGLVREGSPFKYTPRRGWWVFQG